MALKFLIETVRLGAKLDCDGARRSWTLTVMKFYDWLRETFPTPRRIRQRQANLRVRRTSAASQWAIRYFPVEMERVASSVAYALCEIEGMDTPLYLSQTAI